MEGKRFGRVNEAEVEFSKHLELIPLPQHDTPIAFTTQRHQVLLFKRGGESAAEEFVALQLYIVLVRLWQCLSLLAARDFVD